MWNKELRELLTQHVQSTQMCLTEIVELKKKDNDLTEQLIRMEGRIELSIEHAEMSNMELLQRVANDLGSQYVTKLELSGLVQRLEKERARDITTLKVAISVVTIIGTLLNWFLDKGIIHV